MQTVVLGYLTTPVGTHYLHRPLWKTLTQFKATGESTLPKFIIYIHLSTLNLISC